MPVLESFRNLSLIRVVEKITPTRYAPVIAAILKTSAINARKHNMIAKMIIFSLQAAPWQRVINLDMITPTIKVSTKKDIILITSPMMLLFPDGLTIPVMTASK